MRTKALLVSAVVVGLLAIAFQGIGPSAARAVSVAVSQSPGEARSLTPTTAAVIRPAAVVSSWTLLGSQSPGRDGHGFVYDSRADRYILFGGAVSGTEFTNSTWSYEYATNTWTNITPVVSPSPRVGPAMVYDAGADRVILFGGTTGLGGVMSDETWSFDYGNDTWTQQHPAVSPEARIVPAVAYDAGARRTIMFGGAGAAGPLPDTWAYDSSTDTWTVQNVTSPGAMYAASMAYAPSIGRDILFGGLSLSGFVTVFHNETRAFDYTNGTWTNLNPVHHPDARAGSAFTFDTLSDHAIVFGGTASVGPGPGIVFNDTWAYSPVLNDWSNVTPASGPSARLFPVMDFDALANRTVLFGGATTAGVPYDDAWAFRYNLSVPNAPRNLVASAGAARVILTWQAPLDDGGLPITNYTIYRGTTSGGEALLTAVGKVLTYDDRAVTPGTTYYYEVDAVTAVGEGPKSNEASATPLAATPPSAPQNLGATSGNAQVVLSWQAPASNGTSALTSYDVYRGTASGGETLLTTLGVVLTYTDAAVTNGVTYYYKVSAVNGAGEGPKSNEASAMPATVPSAPVALVATGGTLQVAITWGAPTSNGGVAVTGYRIYRGTTAGAETLLTAVGTAQTYTDTAVQVGLTYYYEVSALNGVGEGPKSNEAQAVPHAAPDTTQPTIAIQSPANGSVLSSTRVTVTGTASDNDAVEKVEVSIDGTTWVAATGTTSWSADLTLAEGANTIYARATDRSGNTRTITITVTVQAAGPGTQAMDPLLIAGIAVVIIAAAIAVLLFVLRRRKRVAPPPPPPPPP